jgi:hypothetical protein
MVDGILEQIAADVAEIKSMLASGAGAASAEKPAKSTKSTKADKADKPSFTAEQLRDKFLEVQGKHGDAAAKTLIADLGYDKLAKLIADAPNWQKAWDAAEAKLAEDADDGDDNGGL